jgi:TonB family protein
MAHPPSSPPNPAPQDPTRPWNQPIGGNSLEHLATLLNQHGAGPASADLALDILLNEVVEQACLATNATAAAIALVRDGHYVCRATTGRNAPDLGAILNTEAGLSAACVISGQVQRCDDTETDPRVNAAACRELGVRSVLVVPLFIDRSLMGIFEIFSPLPSAFTDREVQTLQALARRIAESMSPTAPAPRHNPPPLPAVEPKYEEDLFVESTPSWVTLPEPLVFVKPSLKARVYSRDYLTLALTVMLIGFSLLLGWMLGHIGWQKTEIAGRVPSAPAQATKAVANGDPIGAKSDTLPEPAAEGKQVASGVLASEPKSSSALTVYENGKLVFQVAPLAGRHAGVEYASRKSSDPLQIPAPVALARLVQRTEPQYPDSARQQHIQGPVVLVALIGKDGIVRELKATSGDPQLIMAAADAVRQWRFKPLAIKNGAVPFETQITVDFKLP